jgi:hypothetical protein
VRKSAVLVDDADELQSCQTFFYQAEPGCRSCDLPQIRNVDSGLGPRRSRGLPPYCRRLRHGPPWHASDSVVGPLWNSADTVGVSPGSSAALESTHEYIGTPKDELQRVIDEPPDDSSFEEIIKELAFAVMVERGLADVHAGRT